MKLKLILAVSAIMLVTGCASPTGNAMLAGGIVGAVIANEMNSRPVVVVPQPRPLHCYTKYIGNDQYGRAVYQQVCR